MGRTLSALVHQRKDLLRRLSMGLALGEFHGAGAATKLDREDEVRLAAFQSLLSADPKRAIETAGEILNSNSKASESFKSEVVRAFRSQRFWTSGQGIVGFSSNGVGTQLTPLLRETLVKSFQNEF